MLTSSTTTEILKAAIAEFVDARVRNPSVNLVETDFAAQDDIANLLVLFRILSKIAESVPEAKFAAYIAQIPQAGSEGDAAVEALLAASMSGNEHIEELRSIYCSYVLSLSNSVCISILSASYLSAFIVTRSLLELLVGVGARATGTMSEKIQNLSMLAEDERKTISQCWRELSGWAHPHQRWVKKLRPSSVGDLPAYDRELLREATVYLGICVDLAFAISFSKFAVNPKTVQRSCEAQHVDYRRFQLLARRIDAK